MQVKSRKTNIGTYVIYIILFFILLAVNGLVQFVAASFAWEIILTATYWLKTLLGTLSGLSAFILFAFMRRDKRVDTDIEYNKSLNDLNVTIGAKQILNFGEYLELENRTMKIQAWHLKMEEEIRKENHSFSNKQLQIRRMIETNTLKSSKSIIKKIRVRKVKNKLLRIEALTNQLTPQYIQENIDYVRVRHIEITQAEIINGHRGAQSKTKIINNNPIGMIMTKKLPMILLTLGIQAFYNALIIISITGTITMLIAILVQLFTIFMNVVFGINYGNTLFKEIDQNNLLVRRTIFAQYLEWDKAADKSKANGNLIGKIDRKKEEAEKIAQEGQNKWKNC